MKILSLLVIIVFAPNSILVASELFPAAAKIHKTFGELPKLAKVIRGQTSLTLYEGLPHQVWEQEGLKKELEEKETVKQHKFHFYKKANKVSKDDEAALRKLCCGKGAFRPYQGPKACGGFHPDFSLHWSDGKETVELHVCFGCHEMRGYFGETYVYCELTDAGFAWFQKILARYKLQRPKS